MEKRSLTGLFWLYVVFEMGIREVEERDKAY